MADSRPSPEFMAEALELALGGLESVSPNPLVGAVVVRGGKVIGRGFHRGFGRPHAEREALRAAGNARGADLYVTLEPCAHHGKTPPCCEAVLEAGIKRVFFSASDPNPETRGKGPRLLRKAGVEVRGGLLRKEALSQNAPYFFWRDKGRPWVVLKWAMSLDGKIATAGGESQWITGAKARARGHSLRRRVDAVLVGTETVLADDPLLTPRPAGGRAPLRVILDRRGRLPMKLKLLSPPRVAGRGRRLYVSVPGANSVRRLGELERRGVETLLLPSAAAGLDLGLLLAELAKLEVTQLLVEGGARLAGAFLRDALVQEIAAFVAPKIIGGEDALSPVGGEGFRKLKESLSLSDLRHEALGADLFLSAKVRPAGSAR
ncbi:MAG: bifunctional diaminohydroxyphosphoribosylaminopyrimidine deaminase/5-amino-6-(5-phosphoribosylamino)uracil reductase RibD [Planctomycetota bacterium]|nr:bifunctional diaminohydroxyphosphoribosylaminopyrimidine deaminase/5-amino-6-(5-phosphoribosylamino)uracil reductase RibD [Planctomycetota bacterium]